MLSCESCEIFKKTYFAEHLWTTAFESGAHLSSNFRNFFRGDKQIGEYFESKQTLIMFLLTYLMSKDYFFKKQTNKQTNVKRLRVSLTLS